MNLDKLQIVTPLGSPNRSFPKNSQNIPGTPPKPAGQNFSTANPQKNSGGLSHNLGTPPKKSGVFDILLPAKSASKTIEPKKAGFWTPSAKPANTNLAKGSQTQPRTIPELKKTLLKKSSLTRSERDTILTTAKEMAGYKYKDWQAKKVADNLIKNRVAHGFSSTDCQAIKDTLIRKK